MNLRPALHIVRLTGWLMVSCAIIRLIEAVTLHWDAWASVPPFLFGCVVLYVTGRKP